MASLLEDLADPCAYPAPRPTSVERRETHISWVFLTDTEAYKLKKPVELGFLDFRSLEQRRHACDAEVRLNARLARDVYLGVVPVTRSEDGRHCVMGEGETVEWAVRMRRLPDDQRADERLARLELDGPQIDGVATRLAQFHRDAATGDDITAFGRPEAIAVNVDENFRQVGSALARYVGMDEARAIERFQRQFLTDNRVLFEQRAASGHIRDGHGDLRLEHVYLPDGGPLTIIDCIEFNDRFRYGDVCADIAFLSMDLSWHGSVNLAERLLATYARETNDFELYALIDFYESYRAFVRGKVCHLLAEDQGAPSQTRERAQAEARRYFLLALSTDRRALLGPAVIAVGGLIASGKSTVSSALGSRMSAPVIDADRTRKHMLGVAADTPVPEGAWKGAYSPRFTDAVYEEVCRRAAIVVASGRPVVLDASFRSAALRDRARALARAHGVPFRFVECRATPSVCRDRLRTREATRGVSDGRLAIFDDFASQFEPVVELPAEVHVILDTTRPLAETLSRLSTQIAIWPPGLVA